MRQKDLSVNRTKYEEMGNMGPSCSESLTDQPAWGACIICCLAFHVAGVKGDTQKHCKQTWKSNFKQLNASETVFVITVSAWRKHGLLIYMPS